MEFENLLIVVIPNLLVVARQPDSSLPNVNELLLRYVIDIERQPEDFFPKTSDSPWISTLSRVEQHLLQHASWRPAPRNTVLPIADLIAQMSFAEPSVLS